MPGSERAVVLSIALLSLCSVPFVAAEDREFKADLSGYNEVIAAGGAVSTPATGEFRAKLRDNETRLDYELSYGGLQGIVTQAHIHFGQPSTTGSIVVYPCETAGSPDPAGLAPRAYRRAR
jgi:hypothetical protein